MLLFIPLLLSTVSTAQHCTYNPTIHYFRLNNTTRGTILSDGPLFFTGEEFNVPFEAYKRSFEALFRRTDPGIAQQNVLLLDTSAGRLLVDTGSLGAQSFPIASQAGRFSDNLKAAKVNPRTIDAVLLTHAHFDHVGGLVSTTGERTFPNAKIYISKIEHDFWNGEYKTANVTRVPLEIQDLTANFYQSVIAPYLPNDLILVQQNTSPFPGVHFLPTPGHTPGHSAIQIDIGSQQFIIAGDAFVLHPGQLRHPEWEFSAEIDAGLAYNTRISLLEKLAAQRVLVHSYHEQFPGLGYIISQQDRFEWIAAEIGTNGIGVSTKC